MSVGDRVVLQVIWGHPHNPQTLCGFENLDPDWFHLGTFTHPGAFAEHIVLAEDHVIPIPDTVSWDNAALVEVLSIAVNAVEQSPVGIGQTALIVGPGSIGLLSAAQAIRAGAGKTIVAGLAGIDDARLDVARRLGVDHVVRVGDDIASALEEIRELTHGAGADVIFDNGGTAGSTSLALDAAAPAAHVSLTGFTPNVALEPMRQIVRKGLTLHGIAASQRRHYGPAIRMIESGLEPVRIVSHHLPMADATEGMELMLDRSASKVLLHA